MLLCIVLLHKQLEKLYKLMTDVRCRAVVIA